MLRKHIITVRASYSEEVSLLKSGSRYDAKILFLRLYIMALLYSNSTSAQDNFVER